MNQIKTSKRLSHILRHCQSPLYIDLNGGWAPVDAILRALNITRTQLDEIVKTDAKTRYAYDASGTLIRANQGHSIPGVIVEMDCPDPPEFLYHGTATRYLNKIMEEGLKPLRGLWVHISSDYDTAYKVGDRHGRAIVLRVSAQQFVADGYELYCSTNGVWQAREVPPKYLHVISTPEEPGDT